MWPFDREVAGEAHAAFDHKTVYQQLHNGTGPGGLSTSVASWQSEIGGQFDEAHALITTGLKKASADWEGAAADAMHSDVAPMAQFVLDAKDVSHAVGQSTQQQADHFADVKNKMPPPVDVTATDSWLSRGWSHLTGGQTDAEAQEQQALAASDHAAAIYGDYRNNSTSATTVASYPTVPQSNGIDAAPQQQSGGPLSYKSEQPDPVGGTPQPNEQRIQQPVAPVGHDTPPTETSSPTTIQHVPVSGPPSPGPPGGISPIGDPVRPPGGGTPPINPIGFYGPPGSSNPGGGPEGLGGTGGSRGGSSSGFGARGGASTGGTGNAPGRGGNAGAGAMEEAVPAGRAAAGTAGRAGATGNPGIGGPAGRGKDKSEEDQEHLNKFMEPTDEHWGTGEKTVPPVIGEPGYEP
jgi:hypothetical protein